VDRGYFKCWRKIINSAVFKNEGLLKVWVWCLAAANHKKKWVSIKVGRSIVEVSVDRGSFIFGRNSAARILDMSPSTVWKRMQKLKNLQKLNIKSDKHYSIISIVNWDIYQSHEKKGDSKGDSQVTAKEQPGDTNKNYKNEKNKEVKAHGLPSEKYSQDFLAFWSAYPKKQGGKEATWKSWNKNERPSIEIIMKAIAEQKREKEYLKSAGRFCPEWPNILTWVNKKRWEDETEMPRRSHSPHTICAVCDEVKDTLTMGVCDDCIKEQETKKNLQSQIKELATEAVRGMG